MKNPIEKINALGYVYSGHHHEVDITYFKHPSGATIQIGSDAFRTLECQIERSEENIMRYEKMNKAFEILKERFKGCSIPLPDFINGEWIFTVWTSGISCKTFTDKEVLTA
jgi:hypothetical protein